MGKSIILPIPEELGLRLAHPTEHDVPRPGDVIHDAPLGRAVLPVTGRVESVPHFVRVGSGIDHDVCGWQYVIQQTKRVVIVADAAAIANVFPQHRNTIRPLLERAGRLPRVQMCQRVSDPPPVVVRYRHVGLAGGRSRTAECLECRGGEWRVTAERRGGVWRFIHLGEFVVFESIRRCNFGQAHIGHRGAVLLMHRGVLE
mmetsp:Transcript_28132/g.67762  ORF Transcript_28132/g.67762 Transcript_28132/m.67762 type:complete len:201 (-) Transcript_28132:197-799(-)